MFYIKRDGPISFEPKNGSWMHLPALLLGRQARRDDAAGSCLQGGATPHGAPKAVLASA
jgi:hypothetical protein